MPNTPLPHVRVLLCGTKCICAVGGPATTAHTLQPTPHTRPSVRHTRNPQIAILTHEANKEFGRVSPSAAAHAGSGGPGRDVLEGGGLKGGWWGRGVGQGRALLLGSPGGPRPKASRKFLGLHPLRRRSKLLAVSLKHWKGRRGRGGPPLLLRCTAVLMHPWVLAIGKACGAGGHTPFCLRSKTLACAQVSPAIGRLASSSRA